MVENPFPRDFKNQSIYLATILAPAILIGVTGFNMGWILHPSCDTDFLRSFFNRFHFDSTRFYERI
jgi:hypothetical protein